TNSGFLWAGWNVQTVDSAGYVGHYTSIALDTNNYPHISYGDSTNWDLKYAKWTGTSWSIQTVDSAGSVGYRTSIALDTNNYPHISYWDIANDDLKYAKWTGTSWLVQTIDSVGDVGWSSSYYTSIALDTNNYPHISYWDIANDDLKYAKWTGSSWDVQTIDSSAGDVGHDTAIALDTNNNPHISYYDVSNSDLKYAKWTGTSWSIQTVDSAGYVGGYTSIDIDTNNYPHISYRDITNGDLKYAKWTGASWSTQTVDSAGDVGHDTAIALDTNNEPHISYYDNTNGDLKYAKGTADTTTPPSDVKNAYAYPSLFKYSDNIPLKFADMPSNANVRVYSIAGNFIKYLTADSNGYLEWNGLDEEGRQLGTGVYIIYVHAPEKPTGGKTIKVIITR
ncbi:MAG: hypothetical protein KJ967_00875, partial [Elusimicrobia bacterium]|nr:hypothetical protein [Elusimicrobiota bacterium]